MNSVTFKVDGMHCDACAARIRTLLERNGGVREAAVSFKEGKAKVRYDPAAVDEKTLLAAIEKGGYKVASTG